MRKKICLIIVAIIMVIALASALFFGKRYIDNKKEIQSLFGNDKYLIEVVDNERKNFYIINYPEDDNFEVLKEYMKDLGYSYKPDERLGTLHLFEGKDGIYVECDVTYFNSYIECCLHFCD